VSKPSREEIEMIAAKRIVDAETLLKPYAVGAFSRTPSGLEAIVRREDLPAAVKALVDARWGYLAAITGLDHPWPRAPKPGAKPADAPVEPAGPVEDRLEALYQFVNGAIVATLRVSVGYHDAALPTICPVIPSATLYERELGEMFGFVVQGTPDTGRLLLPDDWPDNVYPLRKAFKGLA
jgi:NADH:ubiquinone oxidoreductase subunit C